MFLLFSQVTSTHSWSQVYDEIGLPPGCVDAGHGLRAIYQRYLEQFERNQRKSNILGEDPEASIDSSDLLLHELDGGCKVGPTQGLDAIPNHLRASWKLSTDLVDCVDYRLLEHSLSSGLPNEINFALNAMLLMSYEPRSLNLNSNYRLLDMLLKTVGIDDSDPSLWNSNQSPTSAFGSNFSRLSYSDRPGSRALLVATVIRNLILDGPSNSIVIGQSHSAIRFIFLCIFSTQTSLRQIGLEALASLHFPVKGALSPILIYLITSLISSNDRTDCIRGLQMISRLCETTMNSISWQRRHLSRDPIFGQALPIGSRNVPFLMTLPSQIFTTIVKSLCLPDLQMIVLALDAVYSLSCLGSTICSRFLDESGEIESSSSILPTLLTLLNVEAQSLGSDSLKRVRVLQSGGPGLGQKVVSLQPHTLGLQAQSLNKPKSELLPPVFIKSTAQPPSTVVQSSFNHQQMSSNPVPLNPPQPLAYTATTNPLSTPNPTRPMRNTVARAPVPTITTSAPSHAPPSSSAPQPMLPHQTVLVRKISPLLQQVSSTSRSSSISANTTTDNLPRPFVASPPAIRPTGPIPQPGGGGESPLLKSKPILAASLSQINHRVNGLSQSNGLPLSNNFQPVISVLNRRPIVKSSDSVVSPNTTNQTTFKSNMSVALKSVPTSCSTPREFMFAWLRASYTVDDQSSIARVHIYNSYQRAHQQRFGQAGQVSPIDFHSEIKNIFPGVGQVKVQTPSGSVEIHYNNLKDLHAPEPDSSRGINDIMASVMSPKVTNDSQIGTQRSNPKPRVRKRTSAMAAANKCSSLQQHSSPSSTEATPTKLVRTCNTSSIQSLLLNGCQPLMQNHPLHLVNGGGTGLTNGLSKELLTQFTPPNTDQSIQIKPDATTGGLVLLPVLTMNVGGGTPASTTPLVNGGSSTVMANYNAFINAKTGLVKCPPSPFSIDDNTEWVNSTSNDLRVPCNSANQPVVTVTTNCCISNPVLPSATVSTSTTAHGVNCLTNKSLSTSSEGGVHATARRNCLWYECGKSFHSDAALFDHVASSHLMAKSQPALSCKWTDCSASSSSFRTTSELLTHIRSSHLAVVLLNNHHDPTPARSSSNEPSAVHSVAQTDDRPTVEVMTAITCPTDSLSDACQRALTKSTPDSSHSSLSQQNEGPVTKHIRLTAALSLRNFLRYTSRARRYCVAWEDLLVQIAMSGIESSPTLLECLALLSTTSPVNSPSPFDLNT